MWFPDAPESPLEAARWDRQYAMQQLRKPWIKKDPKLTSAWQARKAEAERQIAQLKGAN